MDCNSRHEMDVLGAGSVLWERCGREELARRLQREREDEYKYEYEYEYEALRWDSWSRIWSALLYCVSLARGVMW